MVLVYMYIPDKGNRDRSVCRYQQGNPPSSSGVPPAVLYTHTQTHTHTYTHSTVELFYVDTDGTSVKLVKATLSYHRVGKGASNNHAKNATVESGNKPERRLKILSVAPRMKMKMISESEGSA